jgi:hypothetical protein
MRAASYRSLVTSQAVYFPGPNSAEILTTGQADQAGETLVLLVTHYPGWQVEVDGQRQSLSNVGGYLATAVRPGLHRYVFSFRPLTFYAGLAISLVSGGLALALLFSDPQAIANRLRQRLFFGRPGASQPSPLAAIGKRPSILAAAAGRPASQLPPGYSITVGQPPGDSASAPFASLSDSTPIQPIEAQVTVWLPPGQRVSLTLETQPDGSGVQVTANQLGDGPEPAQAAALPVTFQLAGQASAAGIASDLPQVVAPSFGYTQPAARILSAGLRSLSLASGLFGLALFVYLLTRLVGLQDWPIYFFTDEAIHSMLAADLLRDGFKNYANDFLPTFFENGGKYRLGFTVYVHILPYLFFGKSVFVTRATSALVTLACAAAVGLTLRDAFKLKYWWSGALFLSIIPAWFLHSRTAFEYPMAVTFYALFLYFYLRYRLPAPSNAGLGDVGDEKHLQPPPGPAEAKAMPRNLYLALLFGALSFYSYSPMQFVVVVSGALLGLSDLRYHLDMLRRPSTRRMMLQALGWLVLLALPYVRFMLAHPEANELSLKAVGAYWYSPLPPLQKLGAYFHEYLRGLNPLYWFDRAGNGLIRHLMKGYGHILPITLPLVVIGLLAALKNWRSPAHRAMLIALLAAPSGAALVEIGITRALVMVVPAALLTALGAERLLDWLVKHLPRSPAPPLAPSGRSSATASSPSLYLSLTLAALLVLVNLGMLRDALVNGPTWYTNYSLGGMQYGGRQLFAAAADYDRSHPGVRLIVSPDWGNGTDVVAHFFTPEPMPYELGVIDGFMNDRLPLDQNTVFVMIPEEYERAVSSGKFQDITIEQTLPYPDGRPGFYFVRLRYVDNIDEIMAAEIEQRSVLQPDVVLLDGQSIPVKISRLDIGSAGMLFDGSLDTVARTLEANPLVIELTFPTPRTLHGLTAIIGSARMRLVARAYESLDAAPQVYETTFRGSVEQPQGELTFDQPVTAMLLRLEFYDLAQREPANVHVWEIEFK